LSEVSWLIGDLIALHSYAYNLRFLAYCVSINYSNSRYSLRMIQFKSLTLNIHWNKPRICHEKERCSLLLYERALPTYIVTLVISSTLRPFSCLQCCANTNLISLMAFQLLIHLSCQCYSLSLSTGMPPARWLQHLLQPWIHTTWKAPVVSGHLKVPHGWPTAPLPRNKIYALF